MKPYNKYRLIGILIAFLAVAEVSARHFADESLPYKVKYKWGLIHKQAGHATLSLKNVGPEYRVALTASSERWADKFFQVRDTLNGIIVRDGFIPSFYEKIAHEGNDDKHDTVRFSYDGNKVTGHCTRRVIKKGKEHVNNKLVLEAEGTTVDMLSAYYYMRSLPFPMWDSGHTECINIFSGKRKELLTIKYHGIEEAKSDNKTYQCYHITFIFTSDGGKKTSDDMDAWISADTKRIPIRLEGKLPVGKIHCVYSGD